MRPDFTPGRATIQLLLFKQAPPVAIRSRLGCGSPSSRRSVLLRRLASIAIERC